ncbi:hypothetical protein LY76DRAFT_596442 [Colletotrichum caudatum]|nr:hypothetical protein LY76DRAFT_596442 [Colletotrichum caudatum]
MLTAIFLLASISTAPLLIFLFCVRAHPPHTRGDCIVACHDLLSVPAAAEGPKCNHVLTTHT